MLKGLLRSGAEVATVRLVGMGVGFVLTIVLARELGPEGLGGYGYAVMLLTLAAVPVSNGWATVLLRATAIACGDSKRLGGNADWGEVVGLLKWGIRLALGLTILYSIGLALLNSVSVDQSIFSDGTLIVLLGVLFFDQLSALRLAVLRGLNHPVWGQVPEMLVRPLFVLCFFLISIWLDPQKPELFDAFMALIAAAGFSALLGWVILWRKKPVGIYSSAAQTNPKVWVRSATLLAGNTGLVILNAQIDFLMLGLFGTAQDLGHYRVAMQIGLLSGFVYTAINMIAMQRFAHMHTRGVQVELQASATLLARLAFVGSLPLPFIFLCWGDSILELLFGTGFEAAKTPLTWFLCSQVLNAGMGFAHAALIMAGREARLLFLTIFCVMLNAGLCVLLIPNFGMEGAAAASFAAIGVWNILLFINAWLLSGLDSSILGILPRKQHR